MATNIWLLHPITVPEKRSSIFSQNFHVKLQSSYLRKIIWTSGKAAHKNFDRRNLKLFAIIRYPPLVISCLVSQTNGKLIKSWDDSTSTGYFGWERWWYNNWTCIFAMRYLLSMLIHALILESVPSTAIGSKLTASAGITKPAENHRKHVHNFSKYRTEAQDKYREEIGILPIIEKIYIKKLYSRCRYSYASSQIASLS